MLPSLFLCSLKDTCTPTRTETAACRDIVQLLPKRLRSTVRHTIVNADREAYQSMVLIAPTGLRFVARAAASNLASTRRAVAAATAGAEQYRLPYDPLFAYIPPSPGCPGPACRAGPPIRGTLARSSRPTRGKRSAKAYRTCSLRTRAAHSPANTNVIKINLCFFLKLFYSSR